MHLHYCFLITEGGTRMATNGSELTGVPRMWPAIRRGLTGRCPNCGTGSLFAGFIEQQERCDTCGEHLGRDEVDLLVPFIVVMIVAHVLILVMLVMELSGSASPLVYLLVLVPLSIIVPLAMIRPVKGAVIGMQWARQLSDRPGR